MAGMFTSLLDIDGWDEFLDAVETVLRSGKVIDLGVRQTGSDPMAVLVQPHLDASTGGILFGMDPVTGVTITFRWSARRADPMHSFRAKSRASII